MFDRTTHGLRECRRFHAAHSQFDPHDPQQAMRLQISSSDGFAETLAQPLATRDLAEKHLALLKGICLLGCEELADLDKAVAEYRKKN